MNVDEQIDVLRRKCDNYHQALQAVKALAHEMLWDSTAVQLSAGGSAYFGRRMHASLRDADGKLRRLTPDLVGRRAANHGFVIEVKESLPEHPEHRQAKLLDVQKYDDDLQGWDTPTEKVSSHDIVLLVDYPNSQNAKIDLEQLRADGEFRVRRPFSLLSFAQVPRADAMWIALQMIDGEMTDPEKKRKLTQICMIHPEDVAANAIFGKVQIYDARPPLPLLMYRMYAAINGDLSEDESLQLREEGQLTKRYTLAQLKALLCEFCCPHQTDPRVPSLPDTSWLKTVMRLWVKMDWAKKLVGNQGYELVIKKSRREPFEQFLKVCAQEDCKEFIKRDKEAKKKQIVDDKFREECPLFAQASTGTATPESTPARLDGPSADAEHQAQALPGTLP